MYLCLVFIFFQFILCNSLFCFQHFFYFDNKFYTYYFIYYLYILLYIIYYYFINTFYRIIVNYFL